MTRMTGRRVLPAAVPLLGGLVAATALLALASAPAGAESAPKRGGILEFSVENEIGNYDCHANTSFAALHPLAPHYSTLLKFDGANYPQIKGDLAESWSALRGQADLHFQAASKRAVS